MPAIPPHETETSDGEWDGPGNEARLSNDAGADTYREAYAWVDPDADADTKDAYRFICHEVAEDGTVGAANLQACRTGIGVLNGGRDGTTIPEADYQGVWDHLAKHIRDAGEEPPALEGGSDDSGDDAGDGSSDDSESGSGQSARQPDDSKAYVTLDGSYEQLQERLRAAIQDWAPAAFPAADLFIAGLEATYPDHAVVYVETWSQPWGGGDYHSTTYEVDADGVATLGAPTALGVIGVATPKCLTDAAAGKKSNAPSRNGRFTNPASVLAEADLLELGG